MKSAGTGNACAHAVPRIVEVSPRNRISVDPEDLLEGVLFHFPTVVVHTEDDGVPGYFGQTRKEFPALFARVQGLGLDTALAVALRQTSDCDGNHELIAVRAGKDRGSHLGAELPFAFNRLRVRRLKDAVTLSQSDALRPPDEDRTPYLESPVGVSPFSDLPRNADQVLPDSVECLKMVGFHLVLLPLFSTISDNHPRSLNKKPASIIAE